MNDIKCDLCTDVIYTGEMATDPETHIAVIPPVHTWCAHMKHALNLCGHFMEVRRANGLPTPGHPLFPPRIRN